MTCIPLVDPETAKGLKPVKALMCRVSSDAIWPQDYYYPKTCRVGFLCISPCYRLRIRNGGYIYMLWSHLNPEFYMDKACRRPVKEWWKNQELNDLVDWFTSRGCTA